MISSLLFVPKLDFEIMVLLYAFFLCYHRLLYIYIYVIELYITSELIGFSIFRNCKGGNDGDD